MSDINRLMSLSREIIGLLGAADKNDTDDILTKMNERDQIVSIINANEVTQIDEPTYNDLVHLKSVEEELLKTIQDEMQSIQQSLVKIKQAKEYQSNDLA